MMCHSLVAALQPWPDVGADVGNIATLAGDQINKMHVHHNFMYFEGFFFFYLSICLAYKVPYVVITHYCDVATEFVDCP